MRMTALFFLLIVCLIPLGGLRAQDLDPLEVRKAIDQGVQFLKGRQKPNGNWEEHAGQERCGATALAILALVESGVPKNDPAIQRGMQYLRMFPGAEAGRNYSISLQTMAFCLVDPERDRPLIRQNVELLQRNQVRTGSVHDGGWHYSPGGGGSDLSNAQFSILALYEAERVGVSVNRDTWQRAHRYWDQSQNKDGSWGYQPLVGGGCGDVRGSMTCAGIASLIVTSGVLGTGGASVRGENILCAQRINNRASDKIQSGLRWMANHFSVSQNPRVGNWLYYYLYALERVGRMNNQRFIGDHDWYREGADKILRLRDTIDGAWRGQGTGVEVSTAFALLFLAKGRRPVLMSKVRYGDDDSWNLHPNDVNNMTVFAESRWKIDLTWQNVDLRAASTDDLLQSPVLYLCGNRSPLSWNDEETAETAAKLREYLDQGGFIVAEAQPNDRNFDVGFRELMQKVFPEPGYELALLEASHPIWSAEIPVEPDQLRPVWGVNFGCRTSVVYVPPYEKRPSLSCLWEIAQRFDRDDAFPPGVRRQVDAGLGLGLNILAYATHRELKYKDQIAESATKKTADSGQRRGRIFFGLLDHGGGANSAPRALSNLLQWAEAQLGLSVELKTELIDPSSPELFEYPVLFMHGRGAFRFSSEQQARLRKHLESGGFLFVNSICSSKAFSDSFSNEMRKVFPDRPMEAIGADDPLFSDDYGGFRIETLELRVPEQSPGRKMIAPTRNVVPELHGLRIEDRLAVVFSPNDVSCSLEMAGSLECRGYTRQSAMRLAVNALLYALEHQ